MFRSKYSNFLTILLIAAIILILLVTAVLIMNVYKKYKNNAEAMQAINQFNNDIGTIDNVSNIGKNEIDSDALQNILEQNVTVETQNQSEASQGRAKRKVTYYNDFVMIGYIEIPKINITYPILEEESVASLEKSVAVRYPSHATLNSVGNVVIAGHNYRNGQFFSNLKKVAVGDIVKIKDTTGKTLTYKVYEVYETTPEDTTYITRDCGDNIEVTLVTCTDNNLARTIVKAKV